MALIDPGVQGSPWRHDQRPNTRPTDEELVFEFRWIHYTRWGVSGFYGHKGEGDDFTCMCDLCHKHRRDN